MSKQLHKNFTDGQVKSLFEKYSKREIKLNYILQILRIKRSRFFELLAKYSKDTEGKKYLKKRKGVLKGLSKWMPAGKPVIFCPSG